MAPPTATSTHRVVVHPSGMAVVFNADDVECARLVEDERTLADGTVERGVRYTCPEGTATMFLVDGTVEGHAGRVAAWLDEVDADPDLPF